MSERTGRERTPLIRARSTADLLGTLPVLFGFHVQESLVVVVLDGPRRRVGFRLRLDLPEPQLFGVAAGQVAELLGDKQARAAVVVAVSASRSTDALVRACADRLERTGVEVVDALRCDGSRYWSMRCPGPHCCPPEGAPYDAAAGVGLTAAVAAGIEVLADRAELAARVAPAQGPVLRRMQAATELAVADRTSVATGSKADPPVAMDRPGHRRVAQIGADRVMSILSAAVTDPGAPLSDAAVAQLSVWCESTVVRDLVWAQISPRNAAAHHGVWAQVARRVVPPFEPAVLGLAAFSAWLKGDGAAASCAIERAERVAPEYPMTRLMAGILANAVSPSVWAPVDESAVWAVFDDPDAAVC